jgi:nucleoside-diphosphate-sugar epimerase
MTTLITGAGLIGCATAARLARVHGERPVLYDVAFSAENLRDRMAGAPVTTVTGDINDLSELIDAIRSHGVKRIIHTAGLLTRAVRERPYAGVRVNLMGTLTVLEAGRLCQIERVVFCSSNTVALGLSGACPPAGLPEDFTMRVVSEWPPSVYAAMKLASEWLGQGYSQDHAMDVVSLRLGGVFGPWRGVPNGGPSKLLRQLIESAWRGQPTSMTRSEVARGGIDYAYSADVAQSAEKAAYAKAPARGVYNIAMGRLYDVNQLLDAVGSVVGRKPQLEITEGQSFSGYSGHGQPADLSAARHTLGWELEFPMETAVRDYVSWLEAARDPA